MQISHISTTEHTKHNSVSTAKQSYAASTTTPHTNRSPMYKIIICR